MQSNITSLHASNLHDLLDQSEMSMRRSLTDTSGHSQLAAGTLQSASHLNITKSYQNHTNKLYNGKVSYVNAFI